MHHYYVLVDKQPVITDDLTLWARNQHIDQRRVAETEAITDVRVSTVFLGLDHGFGGTPLLFETMVFGGEADMECWRYSTWDAAQAGHDAVVAALRDGRDVRSLDPPVGA